LDRAEQLFGWTEFPPVHPRDALTCAKVNIFRAEARAKTEDPKQFEPGQDDLIIRGTRWLALVMNHGGAGPLQQQAAVWLSQVHERMKALLKLRATPVQSQLRINAYFSVGVAAAAGALAFVYWLVSEYSS
jgi:hypothetical protein